MGMLHCEWFRWVCEMRTVEESSVTGMSHTVQYLNGIYHVK